MDLEVGSGGLGPVGPDRVPVPGHERSDGGHGGGVGPGPVGHAERAKVGGPVEGDPVQVRVGAGGGVQEPRGPGGHGGGPCQDEDLHPVAVESGPVVFGGGVQVVRGIERHMGPGVGGGHPEVPTRFPGPGRHGHGSGLASSSEHGSPRGLDGLEELLASSSVEPLANVGPPDPAVGGRESGRDRHHVTHGDRRRCSPGGP